MRVPTAHPEALSESDWDCLRADLAAAQRAEPGPLPPQPSADRRAPEPPVEAVAAPAQPSRDETDANAAGRLRITFPVVPRHTIISAEGDIDRLSREALRSALRDAIDESGTGLIAVDLRRAVFMDDWGWAVLIEQHLRLAAGGRRLFVIAVRGGKIDRLMKKFGLAALLTRVDNPTALRRVD